MRRSLPVETGIVAVEEIGQADSTEIRTPFQEHIEQIEPTGEGQDPEDSHVREWERSRYRGVREPETRLPTSSAIPSSERARCCQHARRDRVRQLREPGEARSSKSKHPAAAKTACRGGSRRCRRQPNSRAQNAADFRDAEDGGKEKCLRNRSGKVAFPVVVCPPDAKLAPPPLERPWSKTIWNLTQESRRVWRAGIGNSARVHCSLPKYAGGRVAIPWSLRLCLVDRDGYPSAVRAGDRRC